MRCRFNELDAEGNYTEYINVLTEGADAPDWVEVELTNKLQLELAISILDANPEFNSIELGSNCFDIDVDPEWGACYNPRLGVTRWHQYYLLFDAKHTDNQIEVDITQMVKAFIKGDNYEPKS